MAIPAGSDPCSTVTPKSPLDGRTSGKNLIWIPSIVVSSLLHSILVISNSIVRLAFVQSVTKDFPPVRFQINHESIVPMHRSSSCRSSRFVSNHSILVPEKYGSKTKPVCCLTIGRFSASSKHRSAVRRSCQTIAGP